MATKLSLSKLWSGSRQWNKYYGSFETSGILTEKPFAFVNPHFSISFYKEPMLVANFK